MAVLSAILFTGCSGVHSLTQAPIANSPVVTLNQNNFKVVKHVESSATTVRVFGIGGLSKSALAKNSYADMVAKANLKDNQAIINVSTVENVKAYVVYAKREMVTTGVVIEFCK